MNKLAVRANAACLSIRELASLITPLARVVGRARRLAAARLIALVAAMAAILVPGTASAALSAACQSINNNQIAAGAGTNAPSTLNGTYSIGASGGSQNVSTNYTDFNQSFTVGEVVSYSYTRLSGTGYVHLVHFNGGEDIVRSGSVQNSTSSSGSGTFTIIGSTDHFNLAITNYSIDYINGNSGNAETARDNSSVSFTLSCAAAAAATTTSLNRNLNPAAFGQTVTFTTVTSSGGNSVTGGTVTFTDATNSTTLCSAVAVSSGVAQCAVSSLAIGSHNIQASYSGTSGYAASTSNTLNETIIAVPTVTGITPTSGPAAGATSVTITGTSFTGTTGASSVKFGSTNAASYTVNSDTQITATSPAGSGTVHVTVTNGGATTATSPADQFTYYAPPGVSMSFSSASVSVNGSNYLTINFTNSNSTTLTGVALDITHGSQVVGFQNSITNCGSFTTTGSQGSFTNTVRNAQIAAGGTCTVVFRFVSSTATTNTFATNNVTATGPVALTGGSASASFDSVQPPVLGVALTHSPSSFTRGQSGSVTITPSATVSNTSGTLTLTMPLPSGVTLASVVSGANWDCTASTSTNLSCTSTASITAGSDGQTVTPSMTIGAGAGSPLSFTATLSGGGASSNGTGSDSVTVNDAPPTVTTNPSNQTVTAGGTATFTSAASGVPTPTVQWQVSSNGGATFTNIAGATSTTLSFTANSGFNGNQYRAVFTNSAGTATTTAATLTVNYAPTVTTNPSSQSVTLGSVATFTAAGSGNPNPTVQWQEDSGAGYGNIPGATSTTYQFVPTLGQSGNSYRAVFTNSVGNAATTGATLTVTQPTDLTIDDVTLNEGNSGTTSFTFTVSLSAPAPTGGVTFDIATADNTATGGSDYTPKSLTSQTIPAGSSSYSFTVLVNGDTTYEPNETFVVNITNVTGAAVADGQGIGTIANDDLAPPTISGISPSTGPASGGTSVSITGSNFTGVSGVSFGNTAAQGFTFVSDSQITATSPAGTGTVDIRVTTPSGTSSTVAADRFTYQSPVFGVALTHSPSNFTQGQSGSITVTPSATSSATVGTYAFDITLPTGATLSSGSGSGWLCSGTSTVSCSNSTTIAAGNSGPVLTLNLDIAITSPTSLSFNGSLSGGGASGSATSNTDTVTVAQVPANLGLFPEGNGQSAVVTQAFANPIRVRVTDAAAVPIPNQPVQFVAPTSGAGATFSGGVTTITVNTDSSGIASTGTITANTVTGPFDILASAGVPQARFNLTNLAPTISVTPSALTGITVGVPFSTTISASGGTGSGYTFAVTSGTLPAGLTLSQAGVLSGTPTAAGPANFTVTATDTNNFTGSRAYSVTVAQGAQTISFGSPAPTTATVGGATYTPIATATSGLTVALTIDASSSSVCSISGSIVSFTGAGTCIINANQAGDANWAAAPQLQQSFNVLPAVPTVTSISPSVGNTGGGTVVVITGTSFTGATSVRFGAASANGYSVDSDTQITATSPTGSGTVDVTVTTPSGTSTTSNADQFSYYAAPIVANKSGVAVPYNSSGTAIDLSSSISGGPHTSIAIGTGPAHGTTSISGDVVTYTPAAGYYGADSFTYSATGPGGPSGTATVSLTVATPPPPTASNSTGNTVITVRGQGSTDVNLSNLVSGVYSSIQISTAPQHGTVTLTGGQAPAGVGTPAGTQGSQQASSVIAHYVPTVGYAGPDSFQFQATGPGGPSSPATVSITVVGSEPVVLAKTGQTIDNQPVNIDLTAGATEGPFTSAAIVSPPSSSIATVQLIESGPAGNHTYVARVTPVARYSGTVTFGYTVSNQFGASNVGTVTVTVTARPDPTLDPTVQAISDAQAEATRDFSRVQIGIFMRRAEALHHGGGSGKSSMGVQLVSRNGGTATSLRDTRYSGSDPRSLASNYDNGVGSGDTNRSQYLLRRGLDGGVGGGYAGGDNVSIGAGSGSDGLSSGGTSNGTGSASGKGVAANGSGATAPTGKARAAAAGDGDQGDGERRVGSIAMWAGGAIEVGTRDQTTLRDKLSISTSGLSIGADIKLAEGATIGIGGGYGAERNIIGANNGDVKSESTVVAGYGSFEPLRDFFIDAVIGYGNLGFDTTRRVTAANATAIGHRNGSMWFGAVATGVDTTAGSVQLSGYGRVEWLRADLGSYAETGAGIYNLRFDKRVLDSLATVIGGKIAYDQQIGETMHMTPRLRFEWRHEFKAGSIQRLDYADVTSPAYYALNPVYYSREQFEVAVGNKFSFANDWSIDIELDFRASQGERSGGIRGGITKKF